MNTTTRTFRDRPAAKLAAFACVLGATFGGGALIGAAVGPEPDRPDPVLPTGGVESTGPETSAEEVHDGH